MRTKDRFAVKLLEVNAEPAIEMTGERLRWILEDLFKTTSRTCVLPFFAQTKKEGPSCDCDKLGSFRLCLDIPLRR